MKKALLVLSLSAIFAISGLVPAVAQDQPKPKKDTVNIDTDAKPTTYYDVEDNKTAAESTEKGSNGTIVIIAGVVIVAGAVALFLLRKKK